MDEGCHVHVECSAVTATKFVCYHVIHVSLSSTLIRHNGAGHTRIDSPMGATTILGEH